MKTSRAKQIATKLGYTSIVPFMLTASDKTPNHTRIGTAIFLTLIAAPLLILLCRATGKSASI
jgi:hypothetical protein